MGRLFEIASPGATTRMLYDGDALVAEYSTAGALLHRYVHGPNVDEPLIWYEASSGKRRSLAADHQGSIVAATDTSGAIINAYDEWGVPSLANKGRFQYTGQIWVSELGLYHYKARAYSSATGRFLQTDPVGYDDQINLYAYVGNDPFNRTDPSGNESPTYANSGRGANLRPETGTWASAKEFINEVTDFAPVVGDVKAISEAVRVPTLVNIAAAVTGLIPAAGDVASKTIKGGEKLLYRRGAYDSTASLKSQAAAAEKSSIGIHGVSVSSNPSPSRPGQVVRCASCAELEDAGFKVTKTGNDKNRYTVTLPKPVDDNTRRIWNSLFKEQSK